MDYDFIVVGSGAGGAVLASRLARNDRNLKVLLIEAGNDHRNLDNYRVPAFHAKATEDPNLRWDYFVEHFSDPARARKDPKRGERGIFYPRASALGGCIAHHAMITVYPDHSDWNGIADRTGDDTWRHDRMWSYFERCTDSEGYRWLPVDAAGLPVALQGVKDDAVRKVILAALTHAPGLLRGIALAVLAALETVAHMISHSVVGDTNSRERIDGDREGFYRIPLSVRDGERRGAADFLFDTQNHPVYGANLTIMPDRLVTRVVFKDGRARGVEYLEMARAYRADRKDGAGDRRAWEDAKRDVKYVAASKEVILCGGAFNTPQLLMLSGIGPQPQLDAIHVPAVVVRPGVGANLQDRYEVGVIDDVAQEFEILKGYPFTGGAGDPGYVRWRDRREGLYTTNGGTVAILKRSRQSKTNDCDLFIFGIPGEFAGYELDYSKRVETPEGRSRFSWIILKAHTENFGNVTVTSPDPRDPPKINFKNFKDGADPNDRDLLALEEAVEFIRGFMAPLRARGTTRGEWLPGSDKTGPALREFIVNNAWGHHASCTCKIGRPDDPDAVLDSAFRVIGAPGGNLRVVDASAFPRIPGYFIVLPVYLIAEKASDVILAAHGARTVPS